MISSIDPSLETWQVTAKSPQADENRALRAVLWVECMPARVTGASLPFGGRLDSRVLRLGAVALCLPMSPGHRAWGWQGLVPHPHGPRAASGIPHFGGGTKTWLSRRLMIKHVYTTQALHNETAGQIVIL